MAGMLPGDGQCGAARGSVDVLIPGAYVGFRKWGEPELLFRSKGEPQDERDQHEPGNAHDEFSCVHWGDLCSGLAVNPRRLSAFVTTLTLESVIARDAIIEAKKPSAGRVERSSTHATVGIFHKPTASPEGA